MKAGEPQHADVNGEARPGLSAVVVTVTYGRRWRYLEHLLTWASGEPRVRHVVIVDNGGMDAIADRVSAAGYESWTDVVHLPRNGGSAAGFGAGLVLAAEVAEEAEFILLLDDDNVPDEGSLGWAEAALQEEREALESTAFVLLREDRPEYLAVAKGGGSVKLICNAFLGFDLGTHLRAALFPGAAQGGGSLEVDYAPYGGFLARRELLNSIGLPREDFVLYGDDWEFTNRVVRRGGRIKVVAGTVVRDVERSWARRGESGGLFSPAAPAWRVYLSLRNRVAFEREASERNRGLYLVNALCVVAILAGQALREGLRARNRCAVRRRVGLVAKALWDGYTRRLGVPSFVAAAMDEAGGSASGLASRAPGLACGEVRSSS